MSIHTDEERARAHLGGLATSRAAAEDTNGSLAEPALAAAGIVGSSSTLSQIIDAYRVIEDAVAGVGPLPSQLDVLTDRLVDVAATRLAEDPVHARSLILLGILAERDGHVEAPKLVAPELVKAVRSDWPESTALAAAYLFAHFPADAPAIESALSATVLAEADVARLRRCLARPDFTDRAALEQLGRVWPSPTTWTLNAGERDLDQRWRATLDLTPEAVAALWQSETTALLAFMGAKAMHAVEQSRDA
jgi:hypothetical protein